MQIKIEFIDHIEQRYDTPGDWQWEEDKLIVYISKTGKWQSDFLVLMHELAEAMLCRAHGISTQDADEWDMGLGAVLDEPGEHPGSPYYKEHGQADLVERLLARALPMPWAVHEQTCQAATGKVMKEEV